MKIGIITTWFERGAAYVSRTYMDLLVNLGHEVYIYARGGDGKISKNSTKWNEPYVTRDNKYHDTQISLYKFYKWIKENDLDMLLFNEQQHFLAVAKVKKHFPNLIVGSYIDYYKENTLPLFNIYDFVICNTNRHLQAMKKHPQAFYIKWGVDTDLYKRTNECGMKDKVTFFHSVGMSARKGTDVLLNAFLNGKLYEKSKLIIHTQIPIEKVCSYKKADLENKNIEIIEKTVGAPGLYEMGDVYVYPTRLDGLGLTMYEALSFGMPVITTNYPPMNEIVSEDVGSLVEVADHYCRADAYYYPMSICNEQDLIRKMNFYVDNPNMVVHKGHSAREKILQEYSLEKMQNALSDMLEQIQCRPLNTQLYQIIKKTYCSPILSALKEISESNNYIRTMKYFLLGLIGRG